MARFYTGLRDVQRDAPVAHCRCKENIYRYDLVASIGGQLVHEDCTTDEERDDYPTAPACSFFEEAC